VKFYNLYGATEYLVPLYKKIDSSQTQKEMQCLDHDRAGVSVKFKLEDNKIEEATEIKGDFAEAYYNWGATLAKLAEISEDKKGYYKLAFKKYES
jgi:uncharacterized protein (DUF169 family)